MGNLLNSKFIFIKIALYLFFISTENAVSGSVYEDIGKGVWKFFRKAPKRSVVIKHGAILAGTTIVVYFVDVRSAFAGINLEMSGDVEIDNDVAADIALSKENEDKEMPVWLCSKPNGVKFPAPAWWKSCPDGQSIEIYKSKLDLEKIPNRK